MNQISPKNPDKASVKRAKLKHILLDVDFFSNPKIEALGYRFKSNAQACLIEILCAMSRATNAIVDEDLIYSKIHKHGVEEPSSFFNYIIEKEIISREGAGYSNQPVIDDQENYARKLDASNARVTRYRDKKEALRDDVETRTPDNDNDNEIDHKLEIAIPDFQTPKISKAIERWKAHRKALGKPFDQMALDALQNLYAGRAHELPDDIDYSITNGWKTINAKSRDAPRAVKLSAAERNLEATKEALRQIKEELWE